MESYYTHSDLLINLYGMYLLIHFDQGSLSRSIEKNLGAHLSTLVYQIDVHARLLILRKKSPLHVYWY